MSRAWARPLAGLRVPVPGTGAAAWHAASMLKWLGAAVESCAENMGAAADWAASGAVALTGLRDGPPLLPPGQAASAVRGALLATELLAGIGGREVRLPGAEVLSERAAIAGLRRNAPRSAGGGFRVVRAADGWVGVNLARRSDVELLPAWLEEPEPVLEAAIARRASGELAERARLLGLPAARLSAPDDVDDEQLRTRGQAGGVQPFGRVRTCSPGGAATAATACGYRTGSRHRHGPCPGRIGTGVTGTGLLIRRAEVDGRTADVRVRGESITGIGELRPVRGEAELFAAGGALLPGLHDHHLHLLSLAAAATSVRCGPPEVSDLDGLARVLRAAPGRWVRGIGYHESVAGVPDRHMLDSLVADRPVRVQHRGGALWVLNTRGLTELGLLDDFEDGRLWRAGALLRERHGEQAPPDLAAVGRRLASFGVTGVTDATPNLSADTVRLLARADLPQRLHLLGAPTGLRLPAGLTVGPHKILPPDHRPPDWDAGDIGLLAVPPDPFRQQLVRGGRGRLLSASRRPCRQAGPGRDAARPRSRIPAAFP